MTWGSGLGGLTGPVTSGNSLVGSTASDWVGLDGVTALTNGNYVVVSSDWRNGSNPNAGAVTRGNGAGGTVGAVTAANSLVGTTANDFVGTVLSGSGVKALSNGGYVVVSDIWDDGATDDVGAATYGPPGGITGPVSAANSALGTPPGVLVSASDLLTTADAVVISTSQDQVILLPVDVTAPVVRGTPCERQRQHGPGRGDTGRHLHGPHRHRQSRHTQCGVCSRFGDGVPGRGRPPSIARRRMVEVTPRRHPSRSRSPRHPRSRPGHPACDAPGHPNGYRLVTTNRWYLHGSPTPGRENPPLTRCSPVKASAAQVPHSSSPLQTAEGSQPMRPLSHSTSLRSNQPVTATSRSIRAVPTGLLRRT